MKHQKNYTIFSKEKIVAFIALLAIVAVIAFWIGTTVAEEPLATCWIMCDPRTGSTVSIRRKPTKNSAEMGWLECGDTFQTDGTTTEDGWVKCYGVGDAGEGWIFCGYVATEAPEMVMEQYCSVSKAPLIIQQWQGGPQVVIGGRKQYLQNCEDVYVFCIADGWACTTRGYVKAEYLEVDPE